MPFRAEGRIGASVKVGVRMADQVEEIEIPVLLDEGAEVTIADARDAALKAAVQTLRMLVDCLEGHDELAARQDRQDGARKESWRSKILGSHEG